MLTPKHIAAFQHLILSWFAQNQRALPWRKTHDPYAILVSEIMLQQTQVERIVKYYPAWLKRWPSFETLARASTAEVIRAWAGLGYNRRAVNLQGAARYILDHGGFTNFQTIKELQTIPGVGPGTAGALMNFVWNIDTPFLEVNIKRIVQRLMFGPETIVGWASDKELLVVAACVIPKGRARIWPHALMDFGALACRPRDPWCEVCPLSKLVALRNKKLQQANSYPVSRIPNLGKNDQNTTYQILNTTKRPTPFAETNRYWRGRILDSLRHHSPLGSNELYQSLPTKTILDHKRYRMLLAALNRDGLISFNNSIVSLP